MKRWGVKKPRKTATIKQWLLEMVFGGLLLVAVIVLAIPWFAGVQMRRQALKANERMAGVYLEFLDSNVEGIGKLLAQYISNTYDISVLTRTEEELERYMAKQNVMQKLEDAGIIYHVFDGIFVRVEGEAEDVFLCQVGPKGNGKQVEGMKRIMEDFSQKYSYNRWELVRFGEKDYLLRVVKSGSISCGAWIDMASLTLPGNNFDYAKDGMIAFLDRDGTILNGVSGGSFGVDRLAEEKSGELIRIGNKRFLQIVKPSRLLPVSMAILIPEAEYLHNIYVVQNMIGLLLAVSLLVFPILLRLLSHSVSEPVDRLAGAMKEVRNGNLAVRVEPMGRFAEFTEMTGCFNSMVTEIGRLQRDVYERKIREQKIQLQYLQTQIRPHFFLNTLNVIHSFSLVGRNDLIEKMAVCLSKYFGCRFRDPDVFVSLQSEKEQVENYLELHRLRYHNSILCQLEVEEVLLEAKLPPLVIQTFVENSLKYGVVQDRQLELELVVETITEDGEQKLKILVADNGPGYEKAVLDAAGKDQLIESAHGQGIGINNCIQRLKLIYGNRARAVLSNMPGGGALTELILPLEFMEEK